MAEHKAWAICSLENGDWHPLEWTISRTRQQAIAQFDHIGEYEGNYAYERNHGRVKAKRVRITLEDDHGR